MAYPGMSFPGMLSSKSMQQPYLSGAQTDSVRQYDHRSLTVVGADNIQGMLPKCALDSPIDGNKMPRVVEPKPVTGSTPAGNGNGEKRQQKDGHCCPHCNESPTDSLKPQSSQPPQPEGHLFAAMESALDCIPGSQLNPHRMRWLEKSYQHWCQISKVINLVRENEIEKSSLFLGISPEEVSDYFKIRAKQDTLGISFPCQQSNQSSFSRNTQHIVKEPASEQKKAQNNKARMRKTQDCQPGPPAKKNSSQTGGGSLSTMRSMSVLSPEITEPEQASSFQGLNKAVQTEFSGFHKTASTPISPMIATTVQNGVVDEEIMATAHHHNGEFASAAVNSWVSVDQRRWGRRHELSSEKAAPGFRPLLPARSFSFPFAAKDLDYGPLINEQQVKSSGKGQVSGPSYPGGAVAGNYRYSPEKITVYPPSAIDEKPVGELHPMDDPHLYMLDVAINAMEKHVESNNIRASRISTTSVQRSNQES